MTGEVLGDPSEGDHPDIAVVIVSHRSEAWLERCLTSLAAHAGATRLDVIVVENGDSVESRAVVQAVAPDARWIMTSNRGFGHANNVGLTATRAPFVLFLNPDTEVVAGSFDRLADYMTSDPSLGLIGVRQIGPDGELHYTIRRTPTVLRWLGESLGVEAWPVHPRRLGERHLDHAAYDRVGPCDWTSGSFMLARRESLWNVGGFDEEFFLYFEEPDLCLRLRRAGWRVAHVPTVTILHHGGNEASDPRFAAQLAFSKRLYMRKHFTVAGRVAGTVAVSLGLVLRMMLGGRKGSERAARRRQARQALLTFLGLRSPTFGSTVAEARGSRAATASPD